MTDPRLQGFSGRGRDFKRYRSLGLVLHDGRAGCHLVAMTHIPGLIEDGDCVTVSDVDNLATDHVCLAECGQA